MVTLGGAGEVMLEGIRAMAISTLLQGAAIVAGWMFVIDLLAGIGQACFPPGRTAWRPGDEPEKPLRSDSTSQ